MLNEYDCVKLIRDVNEHLKAGTVGVVLTVYAENGPYEVEFVGVDGNTIQSEVEITFTISGQDLQKIANG